MYFVFVVSKILEVPALVTEAVWISFLRRFILTSIGDLPFIITISDTCKNQPKRLDFDRTINLSSLIVNLVRDGFENMIEVLVRSTI